MGSRSRDTDVASMFGSDSFLDVVANIVGILIILIVLVGVRVRQSAPSAEATKEGVSVAESRANWEKERAAIVAENERAAAAHEATLKGNEEVEARNEAERARVQAEQKVQDEKRDEHEAERKRREKLLRDYEAESRQLESELQVMAEKLDMARRAKREADEKEASATALVSARLKEEEEKSAKVMATIEAEKGELAVAKTTGEELNRRIVLLRQEMEEVKREMPAVKPIRHYPTPLARRIQQEELHFRCKNGRIAYTYMDELAKQSFDQADARFTRSTRLVEGLVGPKGGFRMKYAIEYADQSPTGELYFGNALFRAFYVLEILADSDDLGETKEDVVEPNSALRVMLRSMPATKYAVTLWVYPDSFELAKVVEEMLHEASYTVGIWPRGFTESIGASSSGSRTDSH